MVGTHRTRCRSPSACPLFNFFNFWQHLAGDSRWRAKGRSSSAAAEGRGCCRFRLPKGRVPPSRSSCCRRFRAKSIPRDFSAGAVSSPASRTAAGAAQGTRRSALQRRGSTTVDGVSSLTAAADFRTRAGSNPVSRTTAGTAQRTRPSALHATSCSTVAGDWLSDFRTGAGSNPAEPREGRACPHSAQPAWIEEGRETLYAFDPPFVPFAPPFVLFTRPLCVYPALCALAPPLYGINSCRVFDGQPSSCGKDGGWAQRRLPDSRRRGASARLGGASPRLHALSCAANDVDTCRAFDETLQL